MNVKIIHYEKNDWRIYPLDNNEDDYYLNSYTTFINAKMYVNANFHALKKQECFVSNCRECKK